MIKVEKLEKGFKKKDVLKQVSFEVGRGEVVGLLGENGAGKTTLLRLLSTLLKPSGGTLRVAGYDTVKQQDQVRKNIGVLFGGETGLYQRLTARENIYYFGRLYKMPQDRMEGRLMELARYFAFESFLDQKVGEFSRGMLQKVAIARSLIHDPEVILLDEPTTGLDVTSAHGVRKLIFDLKQQGKTIIFSSHIMEEVERLCDRVVMLHGGVILYDGGLETLFEKEGTDDLERIFMARIGGSI